MIFQIFKKNGNDFELVQEFNNKADMETALIALQLDGGEYHSEINFGSSSMILGG